MSKKIVNKIFERCTPQDFLLFSWIRTKPPFLRMHHLVIAEVKVLVDHNVPEIHHNFIIINLCFVIIIYIHLCKNWPDINSGDSPESCVSFSLRPPLLLKILNPNHILIKKIFKITITKSQSINPNHIMLKTFVQDHINKIRITVNESQSPPGQNFLS